MTRISDQPSKVLIINIFGIGDVLFTTPLIYHLKSQFPSLSIGYVCNQRTASVLESNPYVNRVYIYERDEFNALYKRSRLQFLKALNQFVRTIRQEKFDTVFDFSLNTSIGFLTWLAGIPQRIGFNYKNRGLFLTHKVSLEGYEDRHVVEYYSGLLEELGLSAPTKGLDLHISQEDESWAQDFIKKNCRKSPALKIGIIPGGGASWGKDAVYKRWAVEGYAKLADKLIEKYSADIILMGDQSEMEVCQRVSSLMHHPVILACGQTTIARLGALTRRCSVVILNDGGPLHVAVAAQAQTVSIFGPVDERVYGPYPLDHHVVVSKLNLACRPCYRRFRRASCEHVSCLKDITVEEVFHKVQEALRTAVK